MKTPTWGLGCNYRRVTGSLPARRHAKPAPRLVQRGAARLLWVLTLRLRPGRYTYRLLTAGTTAETRRELLVE